ncbi:hypothetical protein [Acetobacter orientalis]|uniref:hypothetical protein n=1 Tax=Acetobacter orientalis TaxID=146474 RepID=UPI0039EC789E
MGFERLFFTVANWCMVNFGLKQAFQCVFIKPDGDCIELSAQATAGVYKVQPFGCYFRCVYEHISRLIMRDPAGAEAEIIKIVEVGKQLGFIHVFKFAHPCSVGRIFRHILKHSQLKRFIQHFWFSMVGVTIAMVKLAGGCVNRASRTGGEL